MTCVAIWLNKDKPSPSVWAVADSRISRNDDGHFSIIHEHGAKIFVIDYECEDLSARPEQRCPYFRGSVGLAYAGVSAVGLGLYSVLAPLLRHLGSPEGGGLPTLTDMAGLATRVLNNYLRALGASGTCECSVFGWCPKSHSYEVHHITIQQKEDMKLFQDDKLPLEADDNLLLLGGSKDVLTKRINEYRLARTSKDIMWWRAPQFVIKQVIKESVSPTIGGKAQLAIAIGPRIEHYWFSEPVEDGRPQAQMVYLGLDIFEKPMMIGDCTVAMRGMA